MCIKGLGDFPLCKPIFTDVPQEKSVKIRPCHDTGSACFLGLRIYATSACCSWQTSRREFAGFRLRGQDA